MKMTENCRIYNARADCPFLRRPCYQSGFTGKSGPETWWMCGRHKSAVRHVKNCDIAADAEKQKETWLNDQTPKDRSNEPR